MKFRSHAFVLLALALGWLPASAGSIVGTIVRKDTKLPEIGIEVYVMDLQKVTRADAKGRFEFLDVPAGPHPVFVQRQGLEPWKQTVEVAISDTTRVKVELTPLPAPSILTGRVTSGAGSKPVPHAHVQLPTLAYDIQADDVGAYWMFGIAPGTYRAKAMALGYDPVFTTVRMESGRSSIVSFDLGEPLGSTGKPVVSVAAGDVAPADSMPMIRFTVSLDSLPPDPRDQARKRPVKMEILGPDQKVVATVVDQELFPGQYLARWDGSDGHFHPLAAGAYRYQLRIEKRPAVEGDIVLR
jgi:hypothetical protein